MDESLELRSGGTGEGRRPGCVPTEGQPGAGLF